jgi:hypothetical protein
VKVLLPQPPATSPMIAKTPQNTARSTERAPELARPDGTVINKSPS